MPEMTSPDGTETLAIPDAGVAAMTALGWTSTARSRTRSEPAESSSETTETSESSGSSRRGPGRPRKRTE